MNVILFLGLLSFSCTCCYYTVTVPVTTVDATSIHSFHGGTIRIQERHSKRFGNIILNVQRHCWGERNTWSRNTRRRGRGILNVDDDQEDPFPAAYPDNSIPLNVSSSSSRSCSRSSSSATTDDDDITTVAMATATGNRDIQQQRQEEEDYYNDHPQQQYEDGEDEWDRLEQMKKDLEPRLGGYRPYSIDTSYRRRPGQYSWTSKLVFLNIAIYGLQMINPSITRMFAKRSDMIMSGRQLYRVVTPIFLHGSISHLMLNSFSLNNIGPEVEKLFGGGRFLATYLVGGIVGNLASAYYTPNPSLGASGAVFGLMGAYYTFLSRNEQMFGSLGQEMMGRVGSTLGMNVLFGMMSPSIDNWAHIGGGIGGVAMATAFGPKLYYMMLPTGGGSILVDKPALRLPPVIESIPGKVGKRLRRIKRRMQVERYQSELSARPWRRKKNRTQEYWRRRRMEKRRRNITNDNSIKKRRNSWNSILTPRKSRGKLHEFYRRPMYGED